MVMIKAKNSDWASTVNSDAGGNFVFNAVPLGEYTVTVARVGFEQVQQDVMVVSGSNPVLHFALNVAGAKETVNVSGTTEDVPASTAIDDPWSAGSTWHRWSSVQPAPTASR